MQACAYMPGSNAHTHACFERVHKPLLSPPSTAHVAHDDCYFKVRRYFIGELMIEGVFCSLNQEEQIYESEGCANEGLDRSA